MDAVSRESKAPFDIHEAFRRLRRVCAPWPKAAMFELRDRGYAFVQAPAMAQDKPAPFDNPGNVEIALVRYL